MESSGSCHGILEVSGITRIIFFSVEITMSGFVSNGLEISCLGVICPDLESLSPAIHPKNRNELY